MPPQGVEQAMSVFIENSQEGSNLGRQSVDQNHAFDFGTPEELKARVRAALETYWNHAGHLDLHDPDVVLPGTWLPGRPSPSNRS